MSKRSAEVKRLKLLSLDVLKEQVEVLLVKIAVFKNRGKEIPGDLLEKLGEVQRAIKFHLHKYKVFHKSNRRKPQVRR